MFPREIILKKGNTHFMKEDELGMCCSKEMANECTKGYERMAHEERTKETIKIVSVLILGAILCLVALVTGVL